MIGVFDALQGLLIVFSSVMDRTPGPLQAILAQASIPLVMSLSIPILKKSYNCYQIFGAAVTMVGIIVSLIPTFISLKEATSSFQFYWPLIYMLGLLPAVLMSIYEEVVFKDTKKKYDVYVLLAFQSLYQFITITFLFWTDLIPGFGTTPLVKEKNVLDLCIFDILFFFF